MKEEQNTTNQTSEETEKPKKDAVLERLMDMKNIYEQMIKLRKENLDTFKKIDMSKYQLLYFKFYINYNL
jgi:hypothetical protein